MAHISYIATGDNDEIYNKFSPHRKMLITFVLSFSSFLAPVSSTTVLSAVPEVALTFATDGTIVNLSNAMYMLFMGISPMFYGPFGNIYGRRWVGFSCSVRNSFIPNILHCHGKDTQVLACG
jgi:MFS family permease